MARGRRKTATLSLPHTGLSARFARRLFFFLPRRFFFFFPQCGDWSQTTWFLPLLFSLRFVILKYNSKYQSKGQTYILNLFAFAKKKANTKNGIRESDEKSAGCQILVEKVRESGSSTHSPLPSRP